MLDFGPYLTRCRAKPIFAVLGMIAVLLVPTAEAQTMRQSRRRPQIG